MLQTELLVFPVKHAPPATFPSQLGKIPFFQKPWSCSQLSLSLISQSVFEQICWLHLQICSRVCHLTVSSPSLSQLLPPHVRESPLIFLPAYSNRRLPRFSACSLQSPLPKGGVEGKSGVSCHSSAKTPHWLLSSLRVKAQVLF